MEGGATKKAKTPLTPTSGVAEAYCMKCKRKVAIDLDGYVKMKNGTIRIAGKCKKGHNATGFVSKDNWDARKSGGSCPYAAVSGSGEDVSDFGASVDGSATRRKARGKSRSRSRSRKSGKSRSRSRSRKGGKSRSRSRSHSRKGGKSRSRSRSRHSRKGGCKK
jgi:hypothetical protein